ncbi:hypothetical protein BH10BAC4_BH10BAC4_20720 [soil metagenome]
MSISSWMSNWVSSTEAENKLILSKYEAYVKEHGELFEDGLVALTEADAVEARDRKRRFEKIFWMVFAAIAAFVVAALIFGRDQLSSGNYLEIVGLIGAPLIFRYTMVSEFNNALNRREKRVVKGVVTEKQMVEKNNRKGENGCFIVISGRSRFQVLPEVYKTLSLGDIIQTEMLSDDIYMKKKVTVIGKI